MADLAGEEKIEVVRLAEAVQYRPPGIVVSCQWIRVLTNSSNVHALLTDNQAVNSFKSALRFRSEPLIGLKPGRMLGKRMLRNEV